MPEYISTDPSAGLTETIPPENSKYISTDPSAAVIEPPKYISTDPNALDSQYVPKSIMSPEEEKQSIIEFAKAHPFVAGLASSPAGLIPHSWEDVKKMVTLPRPGDVEGQMRESEEWGKAIRGEYGPEAQGQTIGGTALQTLPLFHLPFAKSPLRAGPADLAMVREMRAAKVAEEPSTVMRVSPETGEVFHVDPKTGETVQPEYVSTDPAAAKIEPAAETPTLPITPEQYGQEVRQEPAIAGTAESGGPGLEPAPVESGVRVATSETPSVVVSDGGEVGISQARKPSKIGQSIEAKTVEAKLTKGFSETAGYDPITIKDQANRAASLVQTFPTRARAIVRGEVPLPEGLRGTPLITAMEEHLVKNPDPQLAYELANSPLTSATSAAAQEMRLMAERVPDSLTSKFEEIKRARVEGARLRGETPETIARDITKEVVKNGSKRPTWEAFVNEIAC